MNYSHDFAVRSVLCLAIALAVVTPLGAGISFERVWEPDTAGLPGGSFSSPYAANKIIGMSYDGTVVAGRVATYAGGEQIPFRWRSDTGPALHFAPVFRDGGRALDVWPTALSGDGKQLFGYLYRLPAPKILLWSLGESGNPYEFVTYSGNYFGAGEQICASSFDGSRSAGYDSQYHSGGYYSSHPAAVYWNPENRYELIGGLDGWLEGDPPYGRLGSRALGISPNGLQVVGESNSYDGFQAFLWNRAGGMRALGDLPGGAFRSAANGVNDSGSAVVGWSESANGREAFLWREGEGMRGLGDLPGGIFESYATGVTDDGSVVVGSAFGNQGRVVFVWTQRSGMVSLKSLLAANGINMEGWTLSTVFCISPDGSSIVGTGTNPAGRLEAWKVLLSPGRSSSANAVGAYARSTKSGSPVYMRYPSTAPLWGPHLFGDHGPGQR